MMSGAVNLLSRKLVTLTKLSSTLAVAFGLPALLLVMFGPVSWCPPHSIIHCSSGNFFFQISQLKSPYLMISCRCSRAGSHTHTHTHIYIYIRGSINNFPDIFIWALLLILHTWNSSPLRSNLFRLQCTYCTVPATSGRPHGGPLVWVCQCPSSQPLSSPQLRQPLSLGNNQKSQGARSRL